MLRRASHRKPALRQLRQCYEQLALPWLCPALLRFQSYSSRARPISRTRTLTSRAASGATPLQAIRTLATVTPDQYEPHGAYIPFEGPGAYSVTRSPVPSSQWSSPLPFSETSSDLDPSSLIIINDNLETRPKALRRQRSIGGDINEMLANLDVSLSVGMFDRGAALIRRIATLLRSDSSELLDLHNKYIRSMVSYMILTRNPNMVWPAQRWFEVDMRHGGVEPDATTYALMVRMSLRMLHGPKRDRTVRRYWELAKRIGVEEELLGVPVLSELELGELSEICTADLQRLALGDFEPDHEISKSSDDLDSSVDEHKDDSPLVVRAVQQKGLGLSSLKEALSLFDTQAEVPYPSYLEGSRQEKDEAYAQMRQQRLEADSITSAMSRWRKENKKLADAGVNLTLPSKRIGALLWDWHQALVLKIKEELVLVAESGKKEHMTTEDQERCEYGPYLKVLDPDKLAAVTLISALSALSLGGLDRGIKLTSLVFGLGNAVQEEFIAENLRRSNLKSHDGKRRAKIVAKLVGSRKTKIGSRRWKNLVQQFETSQPHVTWPPGAEVRLGAVLTTLLFAATTVPVQREHPDTKEPIVSIQPAFRRVIELERGHRVGYVHVNEKVIEKLCREPPTDILAKHLPMVSPPRPWTGFREGGFLGQPVNVVRISQGDSTQLNYAKTASERGDLNELFAGLTVLGKTGWRINRPVFDVMVEAWNSGEEVANLAPENPDLPDPEKPQTQDAIAMKEYYRLRRLVENKRSGYHSQRCFQNFQLEIARAYGDETFYLPHNFDFRGRAYPLPPYLNQMGADNCRGLLLFSKGRALGSNGLRWLKIHLANVFGYDKASFQEREAFAMEHLDDIRDSADHGLHGKKWWLKAEDPFQCLAACIELRNALDSPDPAQFVSHLPIHQDGSCNGLQHYAALGGDVVGAQQVNLEPADRPSDIYTGVAEYVKASIGKDALGGDELAKVLEGKITRKIVKQTVMTNVYGVTFLGAIRQVRRQLADYHPEFPENLLGEGATYIARKIFQALSSMFTGAHRIQFWLGDCASRITQSLTRDQIEALKAEGDKATPARSKAGMKRAKSDKEPASKFRSTIIWTTPMKLPVVQPYRDTKSHAIITSLQAFSVKQPHASDVVNKRKQLQAFPPNFIHSLDATHMILSATRCDELGLTFSAVHDSFWTHAGDVDTMNRVLREEFVRMHSDDIVGRLASEFKARYSNNLYLAQLQPNSRVAKKIAEFRSATAAKRKPNKLTELFQEYERLKLLASTDRTEREEGRKMITPGSIFASDPDGVASLSSVQSLGVAAIGHVPPKSTRLKGQSSSNAEKLLSDSEEPTNCVFTGDVDARNHGAGPGILDEPSAITESALDDELAEPVKPAQQGKKTPVWVWLPMSIPPVPPKGEFDVKRLKNSEYFFS